MLKGALLGTVLGVLGMGLGIVMIGLATGDPPPSVAVLIVLFGAFYAAPGAFLLGFPLVSFLRLVRANVPSTVRFFAVAAAAGAALGPVNLLLSLGFAGFLAGRLPEWGDVRGILTLPWMAAAMAGGTGLGLGAALGETGGKRP